MDNRSARSKAVHTALEHAGVPSDVCLLLLLFRFSRTAVARVSDDYYPRDPASSTPHIGACAFNSLYLGALVQPDWDMFQSAHPAGEDYRLCAPPAGGGEQGMRCSACRGHVQVACTRVVPLCCVEPPANL